MAVLPRRMSLPKVKHKTFGGGALVPPNTGLKPRLQGGLAV